MIVKEPSSFVPSRENSKDMPRPKKLPKLNSNIQTRKSGSINVKKSEHHLKINQSLQLSKNDLKGSPS